jgi:DNA helicase-2/ATP-dependent DNA helicase PcrA
MPHLLDQLNPQQRAAVEQTEGPLLILAGAGSGKTRVITYRIAYLIEDQHVPPERILAVTFTNKAADQMKERVAKLLGGRVELRPGAPHVSTFHSFCVSVLRRHIDRLEYTRDFSIYDEDDQLRVLKAAIEELGLGEQFLSPRGVLGQISYAKNCGLTPQELYARAADPALAKVASVFERYQRKLGQAKALDFDDLLLKTVELFYKAPEVCEAYNHRFRYLLVDEYQDTNRAQYQLIRQLTLAQQNLCVVGDEDQSIYRWRGADIQNILSFEKDYPAARIIRLERNYRSTQHILDAATAVVSCNLARKGKQLWTERGGGERVALYQASSADEEAQFVAGEAGRVLREDEQSSVAVLYRTNAQSRVFEEAFRQYGVDYRLVGGFSFYARAEVKDALAYARLAGNTRDHAAFLRIANMPPRGIGETTLRMLEECAHGLKLSLWEALEHALAEKTLPARALKALEAFHALIEVLAADRGRLPLGEYFKSILDRTHYLEVLRQENRPESQDRIENLQELVNAARGAEEQGSCLAEFLDHAALVSDTDDYDERARVTLMTLHSAKGLEFHHVFLAGLEEGLFPHKLCLNDEAAVEEERRLCYVGMTRAKDRLVLSWASQRRGYGKEAFEGTERSRFLGEIPAELLEPLNVAPFAAGPRAAWENAVNSVASAERFLRERGWRLQPVSRRASRSGKSAKRSAARRGWKLGTRVRHPKYGVGTILKCEGDGEETKLTVSFPGYGQKKLMERYASLRKL